jgi:ubiquinone/menaquinone biosynthesis C-methylase UbiE
VDTISNVNYVIADVTQKLPFPDSQFDIFISPVSLNLIGLGRYHDNINPNGIPNLILELQRVMKSDSVMFISLVLGQDRILFNHHVVFSFQTIETLFHGWKIENYLVDLQIINKNQYSVPRFSKNLTYIMKYFSENENIIFLKLVRDIG